ncbi:hypothetical protein J3R83DRAFT_11818 [Lanmaoa asiatica]|nr:hypothetical protein J3R83DRAFT_11818 [Lanmaoa asiatica]
MMANISLRILFAHWLAFLEAIQQFFWDYTPQLLLSTVFPELIEDSSKFSPIVLVPRVPDPSDYSNSADFATILLTVRTVITMVLLQWDRRTPACFRIFLLGDLGVIPEDKPPASPSELVRDDHAQTNMAPYGARGLSFCPVLVGVVYIQSLLHLYMFLMDEIPSFFNHWFENVLVYESLNPIELLDCSRFLHTSLWMAPWYLLRYGIRKAVPCLYRQCRRVGYKSAHPPIPRIVLIRVDGEAVPVNFVEDHQASADVGMWSLKSANLETLSDGESCIATEFEALPMRTVSHQSEHLGEGADVQDIAFARDPQLFVNQVSDGRLEISPVPVEAANEPFQCVKKGTFILPIPGPDTLVAAPSDCDVEERADGFEEMAFLDAVVDDIHQDGPDGPGEREDLDQDIAFSPWSIINDYEPDKLEAPSETVGAISSSVGSQDAPTPVKNVRFAIGNDVGAASRWQASLGASDTDEYTCAWNRGSQHVDDGVTPVQIFDPSVDMQDTTLPEQVIRPVLPVVLGEERVEGNDFVLAESLSPSLIGKPIVNLPSLVATREDMGFMEMAPMVPAAPIEDVATRSPLQILSPITPAVVINMNCIIEAEEEQSLTPLGTEELDQELSPAGHAFDWVGTLNDKAATCETLYIVSPREDRSRLASPSIGDSNSVCSPVVDSEPPLRHLRHVHTLGIASSVSVAVFEVGMPASSTSLDVIKTSPSTAIEVPGTNELEAEILYETPRYCSEGKDLARSLPNELQGPEVSIPDVTRTRVHIPAVPEPHMEPGMEVQDQVDLLAAEKSNNTIISLASQPVCHSSALATELPMTKPSERLSAISDTQKEKNREVDTIPWDYPGTISKPPPERTLSGSMHAPAESLLIPQTDGHIDRTTVLYETPPSMAHSVSLVKPDDGNGGRSMTENTSRRKQDLSASIHAPQKISNPEVQSSVSQSQDKSNRDHRRSVTNPAVVLSERKPPTKPCPPNWTAMPEVVDAFRMFKQASSGNTIRRVSSIAECTNRGPMLGVVGQKGIATNSLNSTFATANIQSRWTNGSGLLLIRDLVSSDPADFNLRTCTNLKTSKIHGTNVMPVQQVLYPGILDIPPYALHHGITPCPVRVTADFSSRVAGSTGIQRQQRCHAGRNRTNAWFPTLDGLPGLREAEIL